MIAEKVFKESDLPLLWAKLKNTFALIGQDTGSSVDNRIYTTGGSLRVAQIRGSLTPWAGCNPNIVAGTSNKWSDWVYIDISTNFNKELSKYFKLTAGTPYTFSMDLEWKGINLAQNSNIKICGQSHNNSSWKDIKDNVVCHHMPYYANGAFQTAHGDFKIGDMITEAGTIHCEQTIIPTINGTQCIGIRFDACKGAYYRVKNIKVEVGDTATPWCPTEAEKASTDAQPTTLSILWDANKPNKIKAQDQVFCRKSDGSIWWAVVAESGITETDGKTCNYINLDSANTLGEVSVTEGDIITQFGHRGSDQTRQGALYLCTDNSLDSGLVPPFIAQYNSVDTFDIANHRAAYFAANGISAGGGATKTSELTNDSGFITSAALANLAQKSEIPTKTSDITNDSDYTTSQDVANIIKDSAALQYTLIPNRYDTDCTAFGLTVQSTTDPYLHLSEVGFGIKIKRGDKEVFRSIAKYNTYSTTNWEIRLTEISTKPQYMVIDADLLFEPKRNLERIGPNAECIRWEDVKSWKIIESIDMTKHIPVALVTESGFKLIGQFKDVFQTV